MKKLRPYIISFIVLLFIAAIIIAASRKMPHQWNERITLRANDAAPYGFAAAKNLCTSLFPDANIVVDEHSPGYWKNISPDVNRQAVVVVSGNFNADEYEIRQLMNFVEKGNYVFIISRSFSSEAQTAFNFSCGQNDLALFTGAYDDSLKVQLSHPPFTSDSFYVYPGKKFESWFESIDTLHSVVLGRNELSKPNFIRMDKGDGSFFIHTAPLSLSNYFILHKNNIHYFEQVMSLIPSDITKLVWNEYYLTKRERNRNEKEPDWLEVLFRYPPFRWGLLTILLGVFLLILLGSRRKQRMIPVYSKPKNESLDFVKTMGRLYYDRKDHQNLAKKMATYFLEHVRSTYKLPTNELGEQFIEALQFKSSYAKGELNAIVSFINYLQQDHPVTEYQLINFQNQLEAFYQNT